MKNARHTQLGFTLLELMVAVAVLATTLTFGVPSFLSTMADNRLATQTNNLVATLALARSEAVKRGTPVTVCRTATGDSSCTTTTGGWEQGWAIIASDDSTVHVHPKIGSHNTLTGQGSYADQLSFNNMGFPSTSGSFLLCDSARSGYARKIEVGVTGRVRIVRYNGDAEGCGG